MAAAGPAALPNDLDLEHVAEEIEDVGDEQRHAVESGLVQALAHPTKPAVLPEDQASRHWTKEADASLATATRRRRPSMRRAVDPDGLWSDARRRATRDLDIDGRTAPPLPARCPSGLDEPVDGEADPRGLAARLAAAVAALVRTGDA